MTLLQAADVPRWLHRFEHFHDSVITACRVSSSTGETTLVVTILAPDTESLVSGWSEVTLKFARISSLDLQVDPNTVWFVLSELYVVAEGDLIGFQFEELGDAPATMNDLVSSSLHVVASHVQWGWKPAPDKGR